MILVSDGFDMRAFCEACGAFKMTMPFGRFDSFFDRPCAECGAGKYEGIGVMARRERIGRWPWQRAWVDRDGNPCDRIASSIATNDAGEWGEASALEDIQKLRPTTPGGDDDFKIEAPVWVTDAENAARSATGEGENG